ncbi:MAG: ImmA/IrrE family metallo-endopeptidase [Thermoguttaceae bacterium]|nr:ImmA/IrrE family metallo-endopeptidase [Thermoguttaceae bacterium]
MTEYKVEKKSRKEFRRIAYAIRKFLNLQNVLFFPVVQTWEILPELFPEWEFRIVDDSFLPSNVHGYTDVVKKEVCIKESVYEGACLNRGRDRMTILHEIAHCITLGILGFRLYRSFGEEIRPCENPEWQANCLAGELLVPYHLARGFSIEEIMDKCGVSREAALKQYKHLS